MNDASALVRATAYALTQSARDAAATATAKAQRREQEARDLVEAAKMRRRLNAGARLQSY